jgi:hypothetical protein
MNYDNPYVFQNIPFYSLSNWPEGTLIEMDGSEITSQSMFSFNTPAVQSQFGIQRESGGQKSHSTFTSITMIFNSMDMYIYKRTYKTFNSAFATSFALYKLFNQIISIILSPIYTYYMNTVIMNYNFDYGLSTLNKSTASNDESVSMKQGISLELTNVRSKRLTTFSALKNVSIIRYILCRRRNKTKAFYEQAKYFIYKHLSVENLFSYLTEYYRVQEILT